MSGTTITLNSGTPEFAQARIRSSSLTLGDNLTLPIGTDHLLTAARDVGVKRFVAQSYCGWPYARMGGSVKTEADALDPDPPAEFLRTLDAIR